MNDTWVIAAIWTAFTAVLIAATAYTIGTIRLHRKAHKANRALNQKIGD